MTEIHSGAEREGSLQAARLDYGDCDYFALDRRLCVADSNAQRGDQVFVDVSPWFSGGNYPLLGYLQLRSFKAIIAFLGRGITEEPEHAVDKHPRTGDAGFNPASTLGIRETRQRPADAIFFVEERGFWYATKDPPDNPQAGRWNRQAFDILYQLFQLTVTDVSRATTPMITISK